MATVKRERIGITAAELGDAYLQSPLGLDLAPNDPINPVGTGSGVDQPPADSGGANTAPVPKPEADNSLLIMGGLALFALVAFPAKSKMITGGVPSSKWFLPAALVLGAGVAYYYATKGKPAAGADLTTQARLDWLNNYIDANETPDQVATDKAIFASMTADEIASVYDYMANYVSNGTRPAPGSDLANKISAISAKYNIFT